MSLCQNIFFPKFIYSLGVKSVSIVKIQVTSPNLAILSDVHIVPSKQHATIQKGKETLLCLKYEHFLEDK